MEKGSSLIEQNKILFETMDEENRRMFFEVQFQSHVVLALRKKRREFQLSQGDIAKRMGVKQSYVSKIENLQKVPTIDTIAKYLYALNYSIEEATEIAYELVDVDMAFSEIGFLDKSKSKTKNYSGDEYCPISTDRLVRI